MTDDQRKFPRYLMTSSTLAIISPNSIMPYQLIDISKNGMAFSYMGKEEWPDDLLELEIIESEIFYIDKLPIRIVADNPFNEGFSSLRRCGVQFGELTPTQESQLEYFIQRFTVGLA